MINLITGKLKLICRYCDEGLTDRAMSGMGDVNEALITVITRLMELKAVNKSICFDEAILVGSLQLALEAMQTGNLGELSAALNDGVIAELERARLSGAGDDMMWQPGRADHACQSSAGSSTRTGTAGTAVQTGSAAVTAETAGHTDGRPGTPHLICLFGYGDGSYYEQLCAEAPEGSTFIVYEPETDSILDLREQLQGHVDFYALETMEVLFTPGYDTVFRTEYADFIHAINENRERILVNKNTLRRFRDSAARNQIANLHVLQHCNLVEELAHILPRSVPVIIVSAGPSLDKNIELLKKAKGHCLIFAVDTAMKYLMERDIMPDLGITVEPIKPMANYADDRCFDVPHIFDCEANPEIVSRERGRIFIYNCRDFFARLLEDAGTEAVSNVASGGSVATAAFAVCYELQMKTIILIGQDLAYAGTATHAGGVESAGINGDIGTELIDGIDGEPVRTRSDWKGYLRWFENAIRVINEQHLDMQVIDATEGGALIHGSHVMTLNDAVGRYCSGTEYDFKDALTRLPYILSEDEYAHVEQRISDAFDELSDVAKAAGQAVRLCDEALERMVYDVAGETGQAANQTAPDMAVGVGRAAKQTSPDVQAEKQAQETRKAALQPAEILSTLSSCRSRCEAALLYPLINNYAVSDIIDEVSRLRNESSGFLSELRQQRLAFSAIADACAYFEGLRP